MLLLILLLVTYYFSFRIYGQALQITENAVDTAAKSNSPSNKRDPNDLTVNLRDVTDRVLLQWIRLLLDVPVAGSAPCCRQAGPQTYERKPSLPNRSYVWRLTTSKKSVLQFASLN